MKKLFTLLLVAIAAVCLAIPAEAQTATRKAAPRKSGTTTRKTGAAAQTPKPAANTNDVAKFDTFVLKKDGSVKDTSKYDTAIGGNYAAMGNDAYFVVIETISHHLDYYVISGDVAYNFPAVLTEEWIGFNNACYDKLGSQYGAKEIVDAKLITFDPDKRTLSCATENGMKTVSIASIPAEDQKRVTWYQKKPASTSATEFGINTFCQPLSNPGAAARVLQAAGVKLQELRSFDEVAAALTALGFKLENRDAESASFAKETSQGTTMIQYSCWGGKANYFITFPSEAEHGAFLKTITAQGYEETFDPECNMSDYTIPGSENVTGEGISISTGGDMPTSISISPR